MVDPDPVVVVQPPTPVVTPPTHWTPPDIPKSYMKLAAMIVVGFMLFKGVAPEKLNILWSLFTGGDMAFASKETTTVTKTESGPNPPKVDDPKASITPEQIQQWIELFKPIIQEIVDANKPKPVVTPPVVNPPVVVTPPVVNPPVVDPQTLRLAVYDATGLAVPSSSVPSGKLLIVKLEGFKGPKIEWTKRPIGDVQFADVGNQSAAIVLGSNSELDLIVTDYGWQQQVSLRIVANNGGQPPPVNPPVVVTPPINPPVVAPPQSKQFTLYIVESADPKNPRSLTTASILNNLGQRNALKDRGHSVVTKTDKDSDPSVAYVQSQKTPLPALAIYDNSTKQFVQSVQLPIDMGMSLIVPMGG